MRFFLRLEPPRSVPGALLLLVVASTASLLTRAASAQEAAPPPPASAAPTDVSAPTLPPPTAPPPTPPVEAPPPPASAPDVGNQESDRSAAAPSAPVEEEHVKGFQVGLRVGYARALDASSADALTYQTPSLLPILLDVGYRTSTHVYLGLTGQLALASRTDCSGASGTCSAKEYRFGGTFQYHLQPLRTFDPWFGIGLGYEILHLSGFVADSSGHLTRAGIVLFDAQIGGDFALRPGSRAPKLGPFVGLAMGTIGSESGAVYGKNVDRSPTHDHQWVTIGVRGTLDL